jgi:predicted DNA-binding helix-hairpin-helix protein
MRFYGFSEVELTTREEPDLPLEIDPKLAWALRNRERFPVDVNKAPREMLLRVPGLGVRNVDRILKVRRWRRLRLDDLAKLRVPIKKALPFIVVVDHTPHLIERAGALKRIAEAPRQLDLFSPAPPSVRSGEF